MFDLSCAKEQELRDGYKYDGNQKSLIYEERTISLTKKEILLLELLLKNMGKVTFFQELQRVVWQDSVMTDNALKSLVGNLRKKLPKDIVVNLSGIGYKIIL